MRFFSFCFHLLNYSIRGGTHGRLGQNRTNLWAWKNECMLLSLRVVQAQAILFLKSMSEKVGSGIQRRWNWMMNFSIDSRSFLFRVVLCRIRLFPTIISKIKLIIGFGDSGPGIHAPEPVGPRTGWCGVVLRTNQNRKISHQLAPSGAWIPGSEISSADFFKSEIDSELVDSGNILRF